MSGPWTSPLLDATLASRSTWRAGDLLEFKHVYEDGTSQGSSLGLVRAERPGIGFDVNLFWVEQGDLKNWLESDTGHGNPGWYSPARSTATDLTRTVGDPPIQPIGTWRLIGRWNHFTLQEISWLEGRRRSHVHAVACAAIDSWRASLPALPEEQDSLTPQSRATANRRAGSRGASAESMPAQTRAHHQHRQPSCDAPARTTHTPRHGSASLDGQFPPLPSLGVPGLDVRGECSEAPQLPFPSVGPDTGSLLAEITALRAELREQPSIPRVAKRGARSGSADAPRDGRGQRSLEVAGQMDDGIARVRFHSIFASRPALITIVYQTSVNISTMTVTASQTGAGHGGGDGATADAGLRTNEHHSNDLANVHGPALCLGARACIAAFLHPHLIVSLLTFLVMLAHSSTSVPSSEKGEQLSRRSSRTSRGDGETFEQPHQSRPSGEVSAGCCMVLLSRRILALWSARGELERTQDPGRVPRQFFARLCDTGTTLPFRNWLCGQTGTQGSCRLASFTACPTSWDETAGAAIGFPRSAHQLRRIMFTRSCGLSFRAWAHGTAASWTPSARSWIAWPLESSGEQRTSSHRGSRPSKWLSTTAIGLEPPASSGSEGAPHQPGRGGAHCPRAQGRDEAQALSRRRGRHEEQGQEHAGRQRERAWARTGRRRRAAGRATSQAT